MKVRFFIHLKRKEHAKRVKKEIRKLTGKRIAVFLDKNCIHQLAETDQHTYEKAFGVTIEVQTATNKEAMGVKYWKTISYAELPPELKNMIEFIEIDRPLAVRPTKKPGNSLVFLHSSKDFNSFFHWGVCHKKRVEPWRFLSLIKRIIEPKMSSGIVRTCHRSCV